MSECEERHRKVYSSNAERKGDWVCKVCLEEGNNNMKQFDSSYDNIFEKMFLQLIKQNRENVNANE